ncbi:MAG: esterase [Bacteroidales bacterium]|nr:esterase [Candidatus Minthousia equi]MDO4955683.1 YqiA/YcfP family alpha/beta fold hydrolase [Bacteroidales bacterium]
METTDQFRPHLMEGKKILYIHGFGSSGQSGTPKTLRMLMPNCTVISPDIPLHPQEAVDLLHRVCDEEKPDLIIGTSMGGMYCEMMYGYDRILVNPAFQIADTMQEHHMMGKQQWFNPRQDGEKEFFVTKDLQKEYREICKLNFQNVSEEERRYKVYGLFGMSDPVVHTFDLFSAHYINAIRFEGEHRMNDKIIINSLMPIIQLIDDRQNGVEKPIVYIDLDDCLTDFKNGWRKLTEEERTQYEGHLYDVPGFFARLDPMSSAVKAFRWLAEHYDTYILSSAPYSNPTAWSDKLLWVEKYLGVPAYRKLILSHHKNLNYGDYLIDDRKVNGAENFMGTFLHFGQDPFKTWEDVLEYFSHLGGQ